MIEVGRISSIWRYPVKSMLGERIATARIDESGLHADRLWAVLDVEHNATTTAKRLPGLLNCKARYGHSRSPEAGPGNAPEVIVGFPDGSDVSSSDAVVHQRLSAYLYREVMLVPLPRIEQGIQYRRAQSASTDLRAILGIADSEPLPELSTLPVKKIAAIANSVTPVGSYVDAYPVHIVSEQSLTLMAGLAPGADFDVRRFRPTFVVDSPSLSPHPEWDWCGGLLHLPDADLRPLIPTIRCVMPAHQQPGLERDPRITRAIAKHSRRCLGVYGTVDRCGWIAEGDVLQWDSANRPTAVTTMAKRRARCGDMRIAIIAVGVFVAMAGILFTLQGFGIVSGSPMTNTTTWSILGPIIAVIGVALAVGSWSSRKP